MAEEEEFLPLTYDSVNGFLRRKAESELNEVRSVIHSELDQLRKMIQKKDLPAPTDEAFLTWFLRSKKHNWRRAFDQLCRYSFQRHNLMNYYGFIRTEGIRVPIERGVCGVLPRRDRQGRVIVYLRACKWDPDVCSADDVIRAMQAILHFCLQFPATQIAGFCFVFDCHLASISTLHLFIKYGIVLAPTITAFPGRFQSISVVNTNAILRTLFPILLTVIPAKLKKRLSFYGDVKCALPEIFDPRILPEEFGGTLGSLDTLHESWIKHLEDYVPRLHATNRYFKRKDTVSYPEDITDQ